MCFKTPSLPKAPAPTPKPDPDKALKAAAEAERLATARGGSARSNVLTRLRDQDVAASGAKQTLGA